MPGAQKGTLSSSPSASTYQGTATVASSIADAITGFLDEREAKLARID